MRLMASECLFSGDKTPKELLKDIAKHIEVLGENIENEGIDSISSMQIIIDIPDCNEPVMIEVKTKKYIKGGL